MFITNYIFSLYLEDSVIILYELLFESADVHPYSLYIIVSKSSLIVKEIQ